MHLVGVLIVASSTSSLASVFNHTAATNLIDCRRALRYFFVNIFSRGRDKL